MELPKQLRLPLKLPRAPDFWWQRHAPAGLALAPLGMLYGAVTGRLMAKGGARSGLPVICIGNFVAGGAGKTPTALAVAAFCRRLDLSPGFLTRGYGGAERGPLCVSVGLHSAADVGDEALLLAQSAPTVIAADRPAGAKLLGMLGVDVVIMDDGFQNPSLRKDLSLVVVDAERGIGNGLVLPAGPLRAPLKAQIRAADALVVLGRRPRGKDSGGADPVGRVVRLAARAGRPTLRATIEPVRKRGLRRRPYLAYCGIGDPAKFHRSLTEAGAVVGHTMSYPDHHALTDEECEAILAEAKHRDLVPITTEKDRVRLDSRAGGAVARLAAASETFPVQVRFDEPRRLATLILDAVAGHDSAYRRAALSVGAAGKAPA